MIPALLILPYLFVGMGVYYVVGKLERTHDMVETYDGGTLLLFMCLWPVIILCGIITLVIALFMKLAEVLHE